MAVWRVLIEGFEAVMSVGWLDPWNSAVFPWVMQSMLLIKWSFCSTMTQILSLECHGTWAVTVPSWADQSFCSVPRFGSIALKQSDLIENSWAKVVSGIFVPPIEWIGVRGIWIRASLWWIHVPVWWINYVIESTVTPGFLFRSVATKLKDF